MNKADDEALQFAVTQAGPKLIAPHHAAALKANIKPKEIALEYMLRYFNGQKYRFYIVFQRWNVEDLSAKLENVWTCV